MIPHLRLLKSRRARSLCLCLLALLTASTALVRRAFVFTPAGQTFTVTNTNDSSAGSLRQAILDANANSGTDTIAFNIPGSGVHTIAPTSSLPTITDPVIIDGYTQSGASRNTQTVRDDAVLLIEVNGANANSASGLVITAGDSVVRGLVINRFGVTGVSSSGLLIASTNGGNVIEGNFIGTSTAGTSALANNGQGITISGSP